MYTYIRDGETAQFWFDDVDEWEVAYFIYEAIWKGDSKRIGDPFQVDYMSEAQRQLDSGIVDHLILPDEGRYCLFVLNVSDFDKLLEIAQTEWCYYEALPFEE